MLAALAAVAALLAAPAWALASPGALDTSWAGGITDMTSPDDGDIESGAPIVIQPDGKIVVAGRDNGGTGSILLARYLPDGQLDPSFGSHGTVLTDVGLDAVPVALALQPNGDLIVGGRHTDSSSTNYDLVARYLPSGALDSSFGSGGVVRTQGVGVSAIVIDGSGRIVVGGGDGSWGWELFRYLPNGSLDGSFGSGGRATVPEGTHVNSLALDQAGRIVVGADGAVARMMPGGSMDGSFGNGGLAQVEGNAAEALPQPDGRIVVGGYVGGSYTTMAAWRLTPAGGLDPSFGSGGEARVPPTPASNPYTTPQNAALAAAVDANGNVALAGGNLDGTYAGRETYELARLTPAGALDTSFGNGGRTLTPLPGHDTGAADSMVLQADGRLMVSGWVVGDGTGHFVLARYLGGGSSSSTTGTGGRGGSTNGANADHLWITAPRHEALRRARRRGVAITVRTSLRDAVRLRVLRRAHAKHRAIVLGRATVHVAGGRGRHLTIRLSHRHRVRRGQVVVVRGLVRRNGASVTASRRIRLR